MNLDLYKGKGVAIVGENGAGKSTLMKIISGIYQADSGELIYNGKKVNYTNTIQSQKDGVVIINQEQQLVESLSVSQNIFLGNEIKNKLGFVNNYEMNKYVEKIFNDLNIHINPKTIVATLTIAQKQFVEIAKALSKNPKVIIFDEPTSMLAKDDTEKLYKIVRDLKSKGVAIAWITHRMEEIPITCEYVSVIRNGFFVTQRNIESFAGNEEIVNLMIGNELKDYFPEKWEFQNKEVLLKVNNLTSDALRNISFELNRGEIVVFYGLIGSGRTELALSIIGEMPYFSGSLYYDGKNYNPTGAAKAISNQIYYLSEDRKALGLHVNKSIEYNIVLSSLNKYKMNKFIPLMSNLKIGNKSDDLIDKLKIKTESKNKITSSLSGGNQQKVSIAKGIATMPKLFILDEPTRGVDVGSRKEIYTLINNFKKQGKGLMIISSDLPEVVGIADRVIVMYEGHITGELVGKDIVDSKILSLALNLGKENSNA
ncbi:sugar ABC transporter ATP-binding protein [Mycoplasma testudineum]|nr:sugar ABC transporter ATP-binding protein [Mycoplasma testudineum]